MPPTSRMQNGESFISINDHMVPLATSMLARIALNTDVGRHRERLLLLGACEAAAEMILNEYV